MQKELRVKFYSMIKVFGNYRSPYNSNTGKKTIAKSHALKVLANITG